MELGNGNMDYGGGCFETHAFLVSTRDDVARSCFFYLDSFWLRPWISEGCFSCRESLQLSGLLDGRNDDPLLRISWLLQVQDSVSE